MSEKPSGHYERCPKCGSDDIGHEDYTWDEESGEEWPEDPVCNVCENKDGDFYQWTWDDIKKRKEQS